MWSMIIVLIGLYLDHICKKKRKDPSGSIRHLTARSRSTISNWCRRLQTACERVRALLVSYTFDSVFLLFVGASCVYIYIVVCRNSRSNRNETAATTTNCWPFILHNSECQWYVYDQAVRKRARVCKSDEWYDNMIMRMYACKKKC